MLYINKLWNLEGAIYKLMVIVDLDIVKTYSPVAVFIELIRSQKQTVQRLMLSKGAKRTIFYHITVILQYCLDKTIARSGDMYRDNLGISTLVIKCFGITITSVQNFSLYEFPLLKL